MRSNNPLVLSNVFLKTDGRFFKKRIKIQLSLLFLKFPNVTSKDTVLIV